MKEHNALSHFDIVTWQDVKENVQKVNPELFSVIDRIDPGPEYKLVRAAYNFGDTVVDKGRVMLPDGQGEPRSLDELGADQKELYELLSYCPTPLALQLENSSEMFLEISERILPLDLFGEGQLFALFETCVPLTGCGTSPIWSVTAGSRSAFMLPKITDARSHNRLKAEYGFYQSAPSKLSDHWFVFKEISKAGQQDHHWRSEILFFTGKWFEPNETDLTWLQFHHYILKQTWNQSRYMRMRIELAGMWEEFASAIRKKNLKPGPYLVDTMQHLVFMGMGYLPAYRPTGEEEAAMPARFIEQAYSDIYQLREYAPIIMYPARLGQGGFKGSIYYSLGMPSLLEGTPTIRKAPSLISELREIKRLLSIFYSISETENPEITANLQNLVWEYYHSESDPFGEIINSDEIACTDDVIQESLKQRFSGKEFSTHGQFLRGCIGVKRK